MPSYIEFNGKSYQVKPSSKKIFDYLKSTRECYTITELAERVSLAFAGIHRYISELKNLGLVKVVRYSEGSVKYKKVCFADINENARITQETRTQLKKQLKNEKVIAMSTSGYVSDSVLSKDDLKKLDELFRIMCVRRSTTNDNLEAFQNIINKLKGV